MPAPLRTRRRDDDADALDATFFALSSDLRRRMLDLLKREGGCNVNAVCEHFAGEIGRFAVMKHLAALERGGLVVSVREGRERRLWFDATPIQLIHERWTTEFSAYWAARLTRLKYRAEGAEVRALPVQEKAPTARRKERRLG
ncbi:MAG: helix-turn-helix transcriptional regulator [Rubrivivax sp.]|nr:helix-turn-helix transcriptional regulator [Rubrivivax sp.]